jgi:hypothetical protein
MRKIAIIGGGWYACHLALVLAKQGHDVTLYEKNSDILSQISGEFSIRLHSGLHYPRSAATREHCHYGFNLFKQAYPSLVIEHEYSVYGLGVIDDDGNPSKVDANKFRTVCQESEGHKEIPPSSRGYQNLHTAVEVYEPSIALGPQLRSKFNQYLTDAGVTVCCNHLITKITHSEEGTISVVSDVSSGEFDHVINASSYQSLLPPSKALPFDMNIVYQPCLSLIYEDTTPGQKPISFIVMDGSFPCLMPRMLGSEPKEYSLTHAKWTIMGSYSNIDDANVILNKLNDSFIESHIKPKCEQSMAVFWPEFTHRFRYSGWKSTVLAKPATGSEFRSALTFRTNDIIYVIPGKVTHIFDVEKEVTALIAEENILTDGAFNYMKGGVLDLSKTEVTDTSTIDKSSTCNRQTYRELTRQEAPQNSCFLMSCAGEIVGGLVCLAILASQASSLKNTLPKIAVCAALTGIFHGVHGLFSARKKTAKVNPPIPIELVDNYGTLTI